MKGTVTIDVNDYNQLLNEIDNLRGLVEQSKVDRVEELKSIFVLNPRYSSISIDVKAEGVIREIYGSKIALNDKNFEINKKEIDTTISYVFKEVEEDEE